ncbi:MAG: DUF3046 domain-containing protein [Corynebacteriales bacterium]|nr:DUF3046 domain-containing protein [Mycobacteriales bacterium]
MKLSEFWNRMRTQFGPVYAESVAVDQTLSQLGGRTVSAALNDGVEPKQVWLAVCEVYQIPENRR